MASQDVEVSASSLLGSLEYPIMKTLWSRSPLTVGDVRDVLNAERSLDEELAYTTVMTVLSRLHDKQIVAREMHGRSYEYRPQCTESELMRRHSHEQVQELVDRYGSMALAQFATALQDASPELLDQLVRFAQEESNEVRKND